MHIPDAYNLGIYGKDLKNMSTTVTGVVKRTQLEHYMNLGTSENPQWSRMGTGWSKVDDGTSAKTESVKYINMDTESTDTTSYNVSYPFELDLMYADPTIKKVYDIYKDRMTLGDCEVEMLTVEKFNGTAEAGFVARKEVVAIAPSGTSENNNKMRMSGNLNGKGDPVKGKFKPDDKGSGVFTPDTTT